MAETKQRLACLAKVETGIQGLDEITYGGLPAGDISKETKVSVGLDSRENIN